MSTEQHHLTPEPGPRTWPWVWLSLFMFTIAVYFVGRHGGRWAETDSAAFTRYIRVVTSEGTLFPNSQYIYPNGYSFQAISAFIIASTGLDVTTLQQLVYPLLTVLVVIPAWVLYRELTGDARGASFATLLLFTQPEFLFVLLRSSHEKFLRLMLILCLFFLVRSFREYQSPSRLTIHVMLFYIAAFALIANNNLLANSFFVALAMALGLGWLMQLIGRPLDTGSSDILRRLSYILLICIGLVYVFMVYAYPPAMNNLLVMGDLWTRLAALFLDVESEANNAYAQVVSGWISLPVYFMVSSANWALLGASAVIWLRQSWRWLRHNTPPAGLPAQLLWLLYSAFAVQGAASMLADASGALASNLQHRIFPSFSIIAVALVGAALARWQPQRNPRLIQAALTTGIVSIVVLSALKASNEPLLSNKWMFYDQEELAALEWGDANLRYSTIWTEFDERLTTAYLTELGQSANHNQIRAFSVAPTTRLLLMSDILEVRSRRMGVPLPITYDAARIYDNGAAELYRLRPETPLQK